jgi:GDP-L-fucose synthase
MVQRKVKIFITGHQGMVGSAILNEFKKDQTYKIITAPRTLDLRKQNKVEIFFKKERPKIVINAAAVVGGVYANNTYPTKFIYDNIMIQSNIIKCCFENKVQKLIFLGSSCVYPVKNTSVLEDDLLTTKLEETNKWYAIAKISGIRMCQAYNKECNTNYLSIMPTNLYGPNDKYSGIDAHVIPALIEKFNNAKIKKKKIVEIWGDGKAKREFLFVNDLAKIIKMLLKVSKKKISKITQDNFLLNIGSGKEISIKSLSYKISKITGFKGKLIFNKSKLVGKKRNFLNSNKIKKIFPNLQFTDLELGLKKTLKEYLVDRNK